MQIRDTRYAIDRDGVVASLAWDAGIHHIQVGGWYEENTSSAARYHLAECNRARSAWRTSSTSPANRTPPNGCRKPSGRRKQFYVQDTVTLLEDRLSIDFGFKGTNAKSDAEAQRGIAKAAPPASSQFASGSLTAKDNFLPEVGARYTLAPGHEVYASYSENMAMFQGGFKLGPQSVSQAIWNVQGSTLEPETSKSFDAGYRYVSGPLQVSLAAYHVKFDNRLLAYNPCPTARRTIRAATILSTMPAASRAMARNSACCGN